MFCSLQNKKLHKPDLHLEDEREGHLLVFSEPRGQHESDLGVVAKLHLNLEDLDLRASHAGILICQDTVDVQGHHFGAGVGIHDVDCWGVWTYSPQKRLSYNMELEIF